MTKNKRFTIEWYAQKHLKLTEENQILKKENEALKECNAENSFMIDCFADEEVRLITENEKLKKENKAQKDTIEALIETINDFTETINDFDIEEVINDD